MQGSGTAVEVRERAREQEEKGVGLGRHVPWPQDSLIWRAGPSQGEPRPLNKEVRAQNRVPPFRVSGSEGRGQPHA